MADYDFGSVATKVKQPATKAPEQKYDFGSIATPVASKQVVPQPLGQAKDEKPFWSMDTLKGLPFAGGETALNFATGLVAKPISDLAGLGATAKEMISPNSNPDAVGFKNYVQNALTYEPRTTLGKMGAEYNPVALLGKGIGAGANAVGDAVAGDSSADSLRGMAGNYYREAIPQAVGFALPSAKGLIAKRVVGQEAKLAAEKATNAKLDANVAKARELDYSLPPAVAGVHGPLSDFFSGVAGGTKLDYGASIKNQGKTNSIVKQEIGHAADETLSVKSLEKIRDKYSKTYEDLKQAVPTLKTTPAFLAELENPNSKFAQARKDFPKAFKDSQITDMIDDLSKPEFSSAGAIDMQKVLRENGYQNLKAMDASKPRTAQKALGEAQLNAANAIDALIDENLAMKAPPGVKNFQSKLSTNLAEARQGIAKTYAVQGALNDATGNVSAKSLSKLWEKQKNLSGGLKDVAEMHNAFEKQMRDVDKLPGTAKETVSNMDISKGLIMKALDKGLLAIPSTVGRVAAKPALLSDWYQNFNVKPKKYQVGPTLRAAQYLSENPALPFGIPRPPPEYPEE